MLNQKDNDFDDLFRRASERYPLRTDSADWDRMAAALDNPPLEAPEEQETEKRRRRRFLWLFLLIPLGGVGYFAMHKAGVGHGNGVGVPAVVTAPSAKAGNGAGGAAPVDAGSGASAPAGEGSAAQPGGGTASRSNGDAASQSDGGAASQRNKEDVKSGDVKTGEDGAVASAEGGAASQRVKSAANRVRSRSKGRNDLKNSGNREVSGVDISDASDMNIDSKSGLKNKFDAANGRVANYPVGRARTREDYLLTVNVVAPAANKDSSKARPKASSKQKSSYLYAGLLAAPDLSTVHFQSTKGVGTTFSLLLGYQFNKRWAVESGVSVDRKRYYTNAEYFKGKVTTPPNWYINSYDGTCYMWEIPINVRYNFSQSDKTKWFATAGLSTYLMTKENYNYNYTWWSGGSTGTNSWPLNIKTPSQYWFSIINLSAGYEHRLGGIGNLRIEPYLRVPLSGLGTGKLNILSAGLNIGITRRLW